MTHMDAIQLWLRRRTLRLVCVDQERLARLLVDALELERKLFGCQQNRDVRRVIRKFSAKEMDWLVTIIALGIAQSDVAIVHETIESFEMRN